MGATPNLSKIWVSFNMAQRQRLDNDALNYTNFLKVSLNNPIYRETILNETYHVINWQ